MINKTYIQLLCGILISFSFACGGGGGGSDSDQGGSKGVRVLHGMIDLEPVTLTLANQDLLLTAAFAKVRGYQEMPSGQQILKVARGNNLGFPFAELPLSINEEGRYSVLVYGNQGNLGIHAKVLEDGPSLEIPEGFAAVRIVHAFVGASGVTAVLSGQEVNVNFGMASEYLMLNANDQESLSVNISRTSDARQILTGMIDLQAGKSYTLLATGEFGLYGILRTFPD